MFLKKIFICIDLLFICILGFIMYKSCFNAAIIETCNLENNIYYDEKLKYPVISLVSDVFLQKNSSNKSIHIVNNTREDIIKPLSPYSNSSFQDLTTSNRSEILGDIVNFIPNKINNDYKYNNKSPQNSFSIRVIENNFPTKSKLDKVEDHVQINKSNPLWNLNKDYNFNESDLNANIKKDDTSTINKFSDKEINTNVTKSTDVPQETVLIQHGDYSVVNNSSLNISNSNLSSNKNSKDNQYNKDFIDIKTATGGDMISLNRDNNVENIEDANLSDTYAPETLKLFSSQTIKNIHSLKNMKSKKGNKHKPNRSHHSNKKTNHNNKKKLHIIKQSFNNTPEEDINKLWKDAQGHYNNIMNNSYFCITPFDPYILYEYQKFIITGKKIMVYDVFDIKRATEIEEMALEAISEIARCILNQAFNPTMDNYDDLYSCIRIEIVTKLYSYLESGNLLESDQKEIEKTIKSYIEECKQKIDK